MLLLYAVPISAFTDVNTENNNYTAIESISKMGIINGYADGSYRPDSPITKAELSTIVANCSGSDHFDYYNVNEYFDDVSNNHWAAQYISYAAVCGCFSTFNNKPISTINTGSLGSTFINIENCTFNPDSYATYEEAVKAIITLQGYNIIAEREFSGEDKYIQCAKEFEILNGLGEVEYNAYATRGDVALIMYNFLDKGRVNADKPSEDDWSTIELLEREGCESMSELFKRDGLQITMYGEYVISDEITTRDGLDQNGNGVRDPIDKKEHNESLAENDNSI